MTLESVRLYAADDRHSPEMRSARGTCGKGLRFALRRSREAPKPAKVLMAWSLRGACPR